MSLASVLVIYSADHLDGHEKSLKQNKKEKVMKTVKVVKNVVMAKKLRITIKVACFPTFLPLSYYFFCPLKKPHLNNKNLKENLFFFFFFTF